MPNVTMYTTPSCVYCKIAKEFFKENNIKYTELNVAEDNEAREEMVEKSGQLGVPVIMVGDQVIVGFDEDKISEALSIS